MNSSNLFHVIAEPSKCKGFNLNQWNQLLNQAYRTNQVARLHALLLEQNLTQHIPSQLAWHFDSATEHFYAIRRDFTHTFQNFCKHTKSVGSSSIFLKGSCYAISNDRVANGRLFNDLDVLVDKSQLSTYEQILKWMGWTFSKTSEYDDGYYRQWSHELPPMEHRQLPMSLDVHHHIVPPISKYKVNIAPLVANAVDTKFGKVFTIEGQIIHTSLHMLANDDVHNICRDLVDIYLNLSQLPELNSLLELAKETNSTQYVKQAIRLVNKFFDTSYTVTSTHIDKVIDASYALYIQQCLLNQKLILKGLSFGFIFIRAHFNKMPIGTLIKHTFNKGKKALARKPDESIRNQ